MRQIPVDKLKQGMVIARPLYDQHHRKLLSEGVGLNPESIRRIRDIGFRYVFIQERGTEEINAEQLVSIRSRKMASEALEFLVDIESRSNGNPKSTAASSGRQMSAMAEEAVETILNDMMGARQPVYFPGIYLERDQLISHSTDVTILTLLIALNFGFSKRDMMLLGRSALFHDVGKLRLDPKLASTHHLDFTEEQRDLYNMHPQIGAVLLEQDPASDIHVTMGVMQHHERQDGRGFPEGLKGSGEPPKSINRPRGVIHRFAEIIAVANAFDNYVSGRKLREPVMPLEAVEKILEETPAVFNPHIAKMAVSVINVFPVGANVEVRDTRHPRLIGYRGVVAESNMQDLYRPKVTFLFDSRRQRLSEPFEVDFADDSRVKLNFLDDL